jgi:hypothetical protein
VTTPDHAAQGPVVAAEASSSQPESPSQATDVKFLALAARAKAPATTKPADREYGSTEVSYDQKDESLSVQSNYRRGKSLTVGTSFTKSEQADNLDDRVNDNHGYWQMKMSSAPLDTGPKLYAEFAQSDFDPYTSEDFGASASRLMKLGSQTDWQGFRFGVGYQSVGSNFNKYEKGGKGRKGADNPTDELQTGQKGTEAWVSRQFGNLGVKTFVSMYQDNLEDDGTVPQFTTKKVGGGLNYMISSWPQLGVTLDYGNGIRSSSSNAGGLQSMDVSVSNVASSLYYSNSSWNGTLYVEDAAGAGTTNVANVRTYWAGGSYFPVSTFSVSPSISYVREQYPEFGVTTDSYATSMSVSYKPSSTSRYDITGYTEYSAEQNRDWAMDTGYLYSSLGVDWDAMKPKAFIKKWSFEVFYDQYVDNMYSGNNTDGFGFMLKLRSSPSSLSRMSDEPG